MDSLVLAGENGPYVGGGGGSRQPELAEEVVWHVWDEASEVPEKLGRLAVVHLEREELADALLSRGVQTRHVLGPQRGVGVSLQRRGDDVLYFRGIPVVQLLDHD
jgi:hypothetical protein